MREQQNYTAGIYCRLSSEDSAEHESMSIGNQKAMLSDYVKRQGWEVGDIYIGTLGRILKDQISSG